MVENGDAFASRFVIRLLRSWSASRAYAAPDLLRMEELSASWGLSDTVAPACARLFELVEAHLGRALVSECCCSPRLSADERALLGLIRHAQTEKHGSPSPAGSQDPCGTIRHAARDALRAIAGRTAGSGPGAEPSSRSVAAA